MKEEKPMSQILSSNTPTKSQEIQKSDAASTASMQQKSREANATVAGDQVMGFAGAIQGISKKPSCRIMKVDKPMSQILNSNTPTSQEIQKIDAASMQQKSRETNATVAGDQVMGFEEKSTNGDRLQQEEDASSDANVKNRAMSSSSIGEETGRERLKRHRVEVAGQVWIPDIWGQEKLLNDWIDCSDFDSAMVPKGILSARAALAEEGRRAHSRRVRVENSC